MKLIFLIGEDDDVIIVMSVPLNLSKYNSVWSSNKINYLLANFLHYTTRKMGYCIQVPCIRKVLKLLFFCALFYFIKMYEIFFLSCNILIFGVHVLFQDIDSEGPEPSDWDKYASEEYEILVAEETANEQLHEGYDTNTLTYMSMCISKY